MLNILKLNIDSLVIIVLFLHPDDMYIYSEVCTTFNTITKYIQKLSDICIPYYLRSNKPPRDYHYVQSIELIKWAKTHKNFKYKNNTAKLASRRGNLNILKYLYNDGCQMHQDDEMILYEASKNGFFDILKWGIRKGFQLSKLVAIGACKNGDFKIIKWLYDHDCPFNEECCHLAASNGFVDVLDFLIYTVDCPYNIITFDAAAKNGQICVLKYLNNISIHDLSKPWWNNSTCATAAEYGQLKTLKWLRKNLCPWDKSTTYRAAEYNKIKILKWAIENKCEVDNVLFECLGQYGLKFERKNVHIL